MSPRRTNFAIEHVVLHNTHTILHSVTYFTHTLPPLSFTFSFFKYSIAHKFHIQNNRKVKKYFLH